MLCYFKYCLFVHAEQTRGICVCVCVWVACLTRNYKICFIRFNANRQQKRIQMKENTFHVRFLPMVAIVPMQSTTKKKNVAILIDIE